MITKVCIDDFAIKKRHTYGTIMVDIDTHKVIDIINSRELEDVKKWLDTYKNLNIVSRDGSNIYRNAISKSHPSAIQITDRFHLIKNLSEYCREYLKSKFKANVVINNDNEFLSDKIKDKEKELNKHLTLENKWKKISVLISNGISKSIACKELNMDIRILNKLLSLNDDQLKLYFKNTIEIRQEIKISKKSILINNCRELFDKKYSMKKIAELLGIDRRTVKKYINPNFTPYIRKTVQNKSILDNYKEYINDLFIKGNTSKFIYEFISAKGYKGSQSNLRYYCSKLKKKSELISSKISPQTIKRNILLKLLYTPSNNIKELSDGLLDKIYTLYPFFKNTINLLISFKEILKQKNVTKLDKWILEAKKFNNSYINSFINGLLRDIDAVKNSIIYEYNNGLAEGSVNKLKVIKRIMYGRNKFELLRNKIIYLENSKKIN